MARNKTISVKGSVITVLQGDESDFFSLTDIAKCKDSSHSDVIIQNWLRNRNTLEAISKQHKAEKT